MTCLLRLYWTCNPIHPLLGGNLQQTIFHSSERRHLSYVGGCKLVVIEKDVVVQEYAIMIAWLLATIWLLATSGSLLQSALHDLRKLLLQNGYPQGIINYHINDVLNKNRHQHSNPVSKCTSSASLLPLFVCYFRNRIIISVRTNIALIVKNPLSKFGGNGTNSL